MGTPKPTTSSKNKSPKTTGAKKQAVQDLKGHAANTDDPKVAASAREAIAEIQKNWGKWNEAKARQKKTGFDCKAKVEADETALKAAVEESIPQGSTDEKVKASMQKLELIEMRWQEYENTKAENVETRKHAKDRVETWREKLERSLKESAQLTLPGVTG